MIKHLITILAVLLCVILAGCKNTNTETTKKNVEALDAGIAKEQARALLPEGLVSSTVYMSGSLRSWIHYCPVRKNKDTQKEHQIIAQEIFDNILCEQFPFLREME